MFDLESFFVEKCAFVDAELDARLPCAEEPPERLHAAMRYAVFPGGKRLRPILCLATAAAAGAPAAAATVPAAAVELLHCYTLVHDDLPCMDDDALRRGKPTVHVQYGEATAILVGDALLTLAFEVLSTTEGAPNYGTGLLVSELACAAGSRGVIGGQFMDIAAEGSAVGADSLEDIHRRKTADLFRAAVRLGAMAANASAADLDSLTEYGVCLGLAFQMADDLLDATPTAGHPRKELSCVAVYGPDVARTKAREYAERAAACARRLTRNEAEALAAIADFAIHRTS